MLMRSLWLYLNIFLLISGTSGIILALLVYRKNKNKAMIRYAAALTFWSLDQIIISVIYYVNNILGINDRWFNALMNDAGFFMLSGFAFLAPLLIYELFDKPFTGRNKYIYWSSASLMLIPCSVSGVLFNMPEYFEILEALKALTFYGVLYYLSAFQYKNIKNVESADIRKMLKSIFYLQMIFYPVMIAEGSMFSYSVYPFGISSFSLFYFLINMAWLYFASFYLHLPELRMVDHTDSLEVYFSMFKISPREKDVVKLLLQGSSYEEIAGQLFIAHETVKTHVNNIYKKSGVSSKVELINLINKCGN
ncbi:MAG: helix-turn-helix domain-containing protein [Bacteroidota bacterium]